VVYRKKVIDADVLELARERIDRAYDLHDHIAVAFSGGKDSTALLNLVLEVAELRDALPVHAFFWDEEAIHPETIEYMTRVAQDPRVRLDWYCVPIKHRNACSRTSPWWHPWAPEDEAKWCRPLPPEALTQLPGAGFARQPAPECNGYALPRDLGTVGVMLGLRASESLNRYRAVAGKIEDNFIGRDAHARHVNLVKPIYDWTDADIWTAPQLFGWDYNRAYDVMRAAGIDVADQRVCPPYGEEPLRGLWQYAVCWPDLWDRMVQRVPGAATAARYSTSELYGFGLNLAGWDPDRDPHQQIQDAIALWPEDQQAGLRDRIKTEIGNHYSKSGEKIPMEKPGATGVTWKYLYKLCLRGDMKGRRTPTYNRDAQDKGRY